MQKHRFNIDGTCDQEKKGLSECISAAVGDVLVPAYESGKSAYWRRHGVPTSLWQTVQARRTKARNTTNYHLQRLSRALKR
jgi:hypothetical protein